MSSERNKELTSEFFSRFSASDVDGALALMTDDATWLLPGKPDLMPAAGLKSKHEIAQVFRRMLGRLKNGLQLTVKGSIAEGDKVAAELESYGELQNGRVYDQRYHLAITFRDGKISAVREYLDTQHVFAVWFQP